MRSTFENLILIGRPASGKSELIAYLKTLSIEERKQNFNIGKFSEIDDFPWLWEKFMEDDMWEELGRERLWSSKYPDGNRGLRLDRLELLDLMIIKFNHEIQKKYFSNPDFYKENVLMIEFSRGGKDGYQKSLNLLSPEILKTSAIMYNKVSFEESTRKNIKRFESKNKDSILKHKAADEIFLKYYNINDWDEFTNNEESGTLSLRGIDVPFVTVWNEPEVTDPKEIKNRYSKPLQKLFEAYSRK